DMTVKVWDTTSWDVSWTANIGPLDPVTAVFSPDGRYVACGVSGGLIRVLEARTGRPVTSFAGHARTVSALEFLADNRTLLSGGFDGYVRFWQVGSWEQKQQFAED